MQDNQKKEQMQDESFRDEVEKFAEYIKTNNKGLIEGITLDTLKKVAHHYSFAHSTMDWYKAIEKRIQELEK